MSLQRRLRSHRRRPIFAKSQAATSQAAAPKGIVVLGVSIDRNEAAYKKFLAQHRIAFDTSFDPEADVSSAYAAMAEAIGPAMRNLTAKTVGAVP